MKRAWVLDASLALAWTLPDESSPRADAFWEALPSPHSFWVPALWWYEIGNAIETTRRRGRISEADQTALNKFFSGLSLDTDLAPGAADLPRLIALAREKNLSVYDAAYLDLAERKGIGLATLDGALAAAARKSGVPTAP